MKKLLALFLALCMILSLTACGNSDGNSTDDDTKTYEMVVSHDEIIDSPIHRGLEAFKEYVETESQGRISVKLYPNGELGSAENAVDMISRGTVQVTNCNSDILSSYNDKLTFLCLPFLFDNYNQAYEVACDPDGALHKLYQEEANKAGFYVLGFPYLGARALTNNIREVKTADDMKGLKIRVKNSDMSVATFDALGCNVTPLAYSEVYTALQQKVVDGQDNPASSTYNNSFQEVQKYMSLSGHFYFPRRYVVSEVFFQQQSPEHQQMITEAAQIAAEAQNAAYISTDQEFIDKLKAAGMEVNEVDTEAFKKIAIEQVWPEYYATLGGGDEAAGKALVDKILALDPTK